MVVDYDFKTLLESVQDEEKRKQLQEQRLKQIKWEFGLYSSFCRLYGLNKCKYESLVEFQNYLLQAKIVLI